MTVPALDTRPRTAIFLMLASSALIAVTTLLAKALGLGAAAGEAGLHPLQVSAGRFFFAFLAISTASLVLKPGLKSDNWALHVGRSLSGWVGVSCMFAAAARMPLADATAISFLSPVVTMLLAVVLLQERVGVRRWGAVALALIGALVLIRPGTESFRPAALIALGAALAMGLEAILIKRLSDREPVARILLINNGIGATVACTAAMFVWSWPTPSQWGMLAVLGLTMLCAQVCFVNAMRRGEASYVIPAFYSTLIFATLYDFVVFGDAPAWIAVAGAAMIVAGVLSLLRAERH
ncbi:MAG: DMT family transporter [Minwuia sp.]|uniref:DMT family transporter n=1 Tax=Minwuia sp. TaxID=2493630 RepID=UPI003A8A7768